MLHGGDIYADNKLIENVRKKKFLDFSVNTNPLGIPPPVKAALRKYVNDFARYPDPHCRALNAALSKSEGLSAKNILCGGGAADLIFRLCFALRPGRAIIAAPTFSEYEKAALQAGAEVQYHILREEDNFDLKDDFLDVLKDDIDIVFLCNPNNPTGRIIERGLLDAVIKKCTKHNILLVLDECFLPFTNESSAAHLALNNRLLVLKAFTKTFSLAGLRLGYIIGEETMIQKIKQTGQYWSVSVPAQIAGLASLECPEWIARAKSLIEKERLFLTKQLSALNIKVFESAVNFILFKLKPALNSAAELDLEKKPLEKSLLEKNILIRSCANFKGLDGNCYRIAVRTHVENKKFIMALNQALRENV